MSPARKTVESTLDEFAEILPGVVDGDHYKRMVPRYDVTSPAIEQVESLVSDLEDRASTIEDRKHAAIDSGDSDGLLAVRHDEQSLPVELHAAKIRLASLKARHLFEQAARVDAEAGSALTGPAQWIFRLQDAVLLEAARIRESCGAATGVSEYLRREAGDAEAEARRLRRIDPTREPLYVSGPKVEPTASGDPGSGQSIWKITTNGRGDVVAINGRALVQADAFGRDLRTEDGYRLRVDGVAIDDSEEPVKDRAGKVRRFVSSIRR